MHQDEELFSSAERESIVEDSEQPQLNEKLVQNDHEPANSELESKDAPKAIIRKENKAIAIIRIIVAVLFFMATVAACVWVYHYTRATQIKAFEADFRSSSSRLAATFNNELLVRFSMISTISYSLTSSLHSAGALATNFSFVDDQLQHLARALLYICRAPYVAWNPLLVTEEERRDFESYVEEQKVLNPPPPKCYLCGDRNKVLLNPDDVIEAPGVGSYTCAELHWGGVNGYFPPEHCGPLQAILAPECLCEDGPVSEDQEEEEEEDDDLPTKIFT